MSGLIHDAAGSSSEHPPLSSSRSDEVPAIFLSHSGKQKPFVENLYDALQRANHTAFFDQHTLPKGSTFPDRIKAAAEHCKLGVVVLSEDFVTSKWPMLELEILVRKRDPERKVLPLFYKLWPADLRCPKNLSRWRPVWEKAARTPAVAVSWGEALRALNAFNGEIFVEGTSEASFINRVVRSICMEVPSPLPADLSAIKGLHRLAKEVAGQFDHAYSLGQRKEACMVGLHGLGGLGKTTICKVMVNFYSLEYLGRSHHLELPTDGKDMPQIVRKCKNALNKLANLSDEGVDNFEQVIQMMGKHFSQQDVFLAIDNVWESSLDSVKKILGVGFSANSKILLTSRSEQVLKDSLEGRSKACLSPLPALQYEEAVQIFQEALREGDLDFVGSRNLVERVLKRFLFDGTYHALALTTMGAHVRKGCTRGDSEKNADFLSRMLAQLRNEDLQPLEDAIRLSYVTLSEHRQHIFLDIAVLTFMQDVYGQLTCASAHQWLSILYKDRFPETKIMTIIRELALDGLVQLETDGGGDEIIRVHDLLSDLAHREATASSRFFISGRTNKPVEEIEWEKLERVVLSGDQQDAGYNLQIIEKIQWQNCPRLQVLCATSVDFPTGIVLRRIPSLRVLYLNSVTLRRIKKWSAASGLAIVSLKHVGGSTPYEKVPAVRRLYKSSTRVFNMTALCQLQLLQVVDCVRLEELQGLHTLKNLKSVRVDGCSCLGNMDGLSDLPLLKVLHVGCERLKKMPDLSRLTCLEELVLRQNGAMEGVGGFSPTLKSLRVVSCMALKRLPDLSGLTCLDALELFDLQSMEELQEGLSSAIKDLVVDGCGALKRMPDLSNLSRLDRLHLFDNGSMEELGGLSSTARTIHVSRCGALKKLPDLIGLTRLDTLELFNNGSMQVGGLSSSLKSVKIIGCGDLTRMPDLSGLTRLESLQLYWNGKMEMAGLSSSLKDVRICSCEALKRMPDMSGLKRLDKLELVWNKSLQEVGALSSSLKDVRISHCPALKKMPDVSGLTRIESLDLDGNVRMQDEVGVQYYVSSTLKKLSLVDCERMRRLPSLKGCVHLREIAMPAHLTNIASSAPPHLHKLRLNGGKWLSNSKEQWEGFSLLRELVVEKCVSSRIEWGCLSPLRNLESLTVESCDSIRSIDVGCLSPLTNLRSLSVIKCAALEEIVNTGKLQGLEFLYLVRSSVRCSLKKLDGFRDIEGTLEHRLELCLQRCPSVEYHWSISIPP